MTSHPGPLGNNLPGTGMPGRLLLLLIALGLPRTVLTDIGVVTPEGSWIYYLVALTPFAVWLAVAVFRRTATPVRDHLLTGALYGLSLFAVHEALWTASPSLGHQLPQTALSLAGRFTPPLSDVILHGYTFAIAMMIGLGVGVTAAIIATIAKYTRTIRTRRLTASRTR